MNTHLKSLVRFGSKAAETAEARAGARMESEFRFRPFLGNFSVFFWVAPRRPAFLLDVSSRTLGRVVCDPELKVPRGGSLWTKKHLHSASRLRLCVRYAKKGDPSVSIY